MVISLILFRLAWKLLQIGTDVLLIIKSNSDVSIINIDDLE